MRALAVLTRLATEDDAATIAAIHRNSVKHLCAAYYSHAQLEAWFEDRPPNMYAKAIGEERVWLAMEADLVLGFLEIRPAEIEKLYVQPTAVRRGIGTMLLQLGISQARRREPDAVSVLALLNAETFYARHGFTKVGESELFRGKRQIPVRVVRMRLSRDAAGA